MHRGSLSLRSARGSAWSRRWLIQLALCCQCCCQPAPTACVGRTSREQRGRKGRGLRRWQTVRVDHDRGGGATVSWAPAWPHPSQGVAARYDKAPIVEAIIEARTEGGGLNPDLFESFADALGGGWDDAERVGLRRVERESRGSEFADTTPDGYAFTRKDHGRRVQVTPSSVGISWLGSYERWEELVVEFRRVWAVYMERSAPERITRLSTRFINVIQIPAPSVEIADYLRTGIDIAPTLPQRIGGYFMQVELPLDPAQGLGVVVTSALTDPEVEGTTAVVLDLDTYDMTSIEVNDEWEEVLSAHLATLREVKNYVFEASITDATRGLIR